MSPSWSWTNKSFTVSKSGHTYAYIHHSPSTTNKPTLLLLHGFPSTSYDWRHQIPYLKNLGYGVLVPDLLGYGSSSKPLAVEPYIGLSMASDIISILDHESIQTVVGVGHDWGTYLLSQLIIWFPERISRCVFVSVPFHIPGRKTDVEAVNQKSRRALGFEILGYWMFLTAPDAGKIIEDNVSSISRSGILVLCPYTTILTGSEISAITLSIPWTFRSHLLSLSLSLYINHVKYLGTTADYISQWKTFYNIIYCTDASLWKTHFAPLGAMRKTLETMTPESSSQYLVSLPLPFLLPTHNSQPPGPPLLIPNLKIPPPHLLQKHLHPTNKLVSSSSLLPRHRYRNLSFKKRSDYFEHSYPCFDDYRNGRCYL